MTRERISFFFFVFNLMTWGTSHCCCCNILDLRKIWFSDVQETASYTCTYFQGTNKENSSPSRWQLIIKSYLLKAKLFWRFLWPVQFEWTLKNGLYNYDFRFYYFDPSRQMAVRISLSWMVWFTDCSLKFATGFMISLFLLYKPWTLEHSYQSSLQLLPRWPFSTQLTIGNIQEKL